VRLSQVARIPRHLCAVPRRRKPGYLLSRDGPGDRAREGYAGVIFDRVGRAPVAAVGLTAAAGALIVLAAGNGIAASGARWRR
jgi:hypothetical protein